MNDDEVWDAVKQTLSDVRMDRPVEAIEQRGRARRRKRHVFGVAAGGGVAAVAALALALPMATGSGTASAPTGPDNQAGSASTAPAGDIRLVSLATSLTAENASLPGDASLIIEKVEVRRGTVPSRTRYHLYTDGGEYYYTEARRELPRVVARGENLGNGFHTRGVAAARYAATGDLAKAREQMINSVYDGGKPPTGAGQDRTEILRQKGITIPSPRTDEDRESLAANNHLWVNSVDVLSAAGGDPKVRAGVLRLISTIPDVTVVDSTTGGQPTLTITARVWGDDSQHVLTINAQNGVPISSVLTYPDMDTTFAETFEVSRVTVADIRAGRF
ncbi:hypothetical protein [Polymorphospora rubra]|uniref:CU044_5270 family protein n=1 Tax=Polymorphospora rubra TaxID=338584 RepID=A0A810N4A4_9ACTN|nr:hypothetical protein [Polymorphospora rubra]BCJ68551.1 hypothetical protein Prubr_55720 [Polymorphospora rubra]